MGGSYLSFTYLSSQVYNTSVVISSRYWVRDLQS